MKRVMIGLIAILIILVVYSLSTYNSLVSLDESVNEKWAQVQNVYQRRLDLIPNLVNTVKGYAAHEQETLEGVVKARASATQTNISGEGMANILNDPQAFDKFQQSQSALSSALSRLLVVVEKYPDLKANENFLSLQSQLEGTENRITVERMRFNEVVKDYNIRIRTFPAKLIASVFSFEKKNQFEAAPEAQTVPKVEF